MKIKVWLRGFLVTAFFISTACFVYYMAFSLRYEFNIPSKEWTILLHTVPFLVFIRLASAYGFGLFSGWLGYAGMSDFVDIVKYNTLSSLCFVLALVLTQRVPAFSRSVLLMDWVGNLLIVSIARFLARFVKEGTNHFRNAKNTDGRKYVLIVGAGDAGIMISREMKNNHRLNYHPIGFIDDNDLKRGKKVAGIPVLGNHKDIPYILENNTVDEIIIAIPSATSARLKGIIDKCVEMGVKVKTTPPASSLINGTVHLYQVRSIEIEDLLGRKSISLDRSSVREELKSKKVLVTGAGGSIGSELAWQITQYGVKKIILYERGESELHDITLKIKGIANKVSVVPIVGDIMDKQQLNEVMEKHKPDFVYHAAAYKHVPLMEFSPVEAVRNNVLGSIAVAKVAIKHGVKKFIFVSTDKAVNPTSVMGATKRAAELVLHSMNCPSTKFIAVRFGNVLDSRGSVVPLFKKQVAKGGPVTVTHPFIIRYFMSIPEASQLIMQAGTIGEGGELFLLDMGEPVKIVDLAENVIRLYDKKPYQEIEIKFTGLRPGEKLYEELFNPWEELLPTSNKKIMRVSSIFLGKGFVKQIVAELEGCVAKRDKQGVISGLKKIVPTFKSSYQLIENIGEIFAKGLELNIKSCGREFKARITKITQGKELQVTLFSSTEGGCMDYFSGMVEVIFYNAPDNTVVRFYTSIINHNNSYDNPVLSLRYPQSAEEREELRCGMNQAVATKSA